MARHCDRMMSEVVQDFLYGIDTGALQYSRYSTMDSTKSPERQLALASGLIEAWAQSERVQFQFNSRQNYKSATA